MRSVLIRIAGGVFVLAAVAHAAGGWPAMEAALRTASAPEPLIGGLAAGWYFGSAAMAAFGILVFRAGARLAREDPSGLPTVRVIAATYVLFGIGAFLARGLNPHFLGFVAMGLLAGLPALPRLGGDRRGT